MYAPLDPPEFVSPPDLETNPAYLKASNIYWTGEAGDNTLALCELREFKSELHIIPKRGRQHRLFGCWCKPEFKRDQLALSPVWVHHVEKDNE